jgi:hypothetical protein
MPHPINRRQKPAWRQPRKPLSPGMRPTDFRKDARRRRTSGRPGKKG